MRRFEAHLQSTKINSRWDLWHRFLLVHIGKQLEQQQKKKSQKKKRNSSVVYYSKENTECNGEGKKKKIKRHDSQLAEIEVPI